MLLNFCLEGGVPPPVLGEVVLFLLFLFFFLLFPAGVFPRSVLVEGGILFHVWELVVGVVTGYLWVPGGFASAAQIIGVLLRLRRPRALDRRASLWSSQRRGSWTIDPAARKRGVCVRHLSCAMLSCPDLPRP